MEQDKLPCALDREVFERVWRRVMPEERPDSPITLTPTTPEEPLPWQAPVTMPAPAPAVPTLAPVALSPAPALPMHHIAPQGEDYAPADHNVPCLGSASAVYGPLLQQYIDIELSTWRLYQSLARRSGGAGGKTLSTMAADERRHAKRLSTAYFLISGVRYWPAERTLPPNHAPLPAILRHCFAEEQRAEAAYLAAAEETGDTALRDLFRELAGDENAHVWLLRGILEQM